MQMIAFWGYVCFFISSWIIYRKLTNPVVLFNLIWLVLIGISSWGYSGIGRPADYVYESFLLGGLVFNVLSSILFSVRKIMCCSNVKIKRKRVFLSEHTKKRLFIILQLLLMLYSMVHAIDLLRFFASGGSYMEVRGHYYSADYASALEFLTLTYIIDPLIMVTELIFALNLIKRTYSRSIVVIMLFNITVRAFISGGRMVLFELVIIILLTLILNFGDLKASTKIKAFLVSFAGTAGAVAITFGRTGSSGGFLNTIIKTITSNFTGSFKYYSILLSKNSFPIKSAGRTIFAGLLDPFISIGRFLGLTDVPTAQIETGTLLSEFYYIGEYSFNAMPTMYYYFYADFGKYGMLVAGAVLALIIFFAFVNHKTKRTCKSFAYYVLVLLALVESPMQWMMFRTSYVMSFLFVALLVGNQPIYNGFQMPELKGETIE